MGRPAWVARHAACRDIRRVAAMRTQGAARRPSPPTHFPFHSSTHSRPRSYFMFSHNKRLQYTVRVSECTPGLANLMLEQFGGPQGELAAACRYFTQALGEDDAGRKDMLFDISTEELSHL